MSWIDPGRIHPTPFAQSQKIVALNEDLLTQIYSSVLFAGILTGDWVLAGTYIAGDVQVRKQ